MDARKRLEARDLVVHSHAEEMVALIRFHVGQCERCTAELCAEGMPELVRRIDEELRALHDECEPDPAA